MMIIVLRLVTIPSSSHALTPPHHQILIGVDYNKQVAWQQDYMWYLGKNLSIGDSYTYTIYDPKTIQTSAQNYHYFTQGNKDHNSSVCYAIKMDFVLNKFGYPMFDINYTDRRSYYVALERSSLKDNDVLFLQWFMKRYIKGNSEFLN